MTKNDGRDRALIGALIDRESQEQYLSVQAFANALGISRSTTYRLIAGDERIKDRTLRVAERVLGLPHGVLDLVGRHQLAEAQAAGLPAATIAWLEQKVPAAAEKPQPMVSVVDDGQTTTVSVDALPAAKKAPAKTRRPRTPTGR